MTTYFCSFFFFFFQAEDGIRDLTVTGVQTCALPICRAAISRSEVNLIHRPACVCSPTLSRMCFGSLSSAHLKNENAHDSLRGITIATFFFTKVKHGLPHLSSSIRWQSSAIWRSLSVSFCHFFA